MKNIETERKFLVDKEAWERLQKPKGEAYLQGYLCIDDQKSIRVRVAGDRGILTLKGRSEGFSRSEFEYLIPVDEARELLSLYANGLIEKTRYKVYHGKDLWEVDEFYGNNGGLLLAEIELRGEKEEFEKPEWVAMEVTEDHRYYNSYLSRHPFAFWPNKKPGK